MIAAIDPELLYDITVHWNPPPLTKNGNILFHDYSGMEIANCPPA